jgi:hypothetical protein
MIFKMVKVKPKVIDRNPELKTKIGSAPMAAGRKQPS